MYSRFEFFEEKLKPRIGFLTGDNRFEPFCFEGKVNTDIVIACFDAFAERYSETKRVVIMDNASIHTSGPFLDCIPDWEEKGFEVQVFLQKKLEPRI